MRLSFIDSLSLLTCLQVDGVRNNLPGRGRALRHINFNLTRSAGDDRRRECRWRRRLGLRRCGNSDGLISEFGYFLLHGRDSN